MWRLIIVVLALAVLVGCGGGGRTFVGVGEEGHLDSGAQAVAVAVDQAAFDAFIKASVAKDNFGAGQLVTTGRVFTVPRNTRVLVLHPGTLSTEVRILEGEHTGQSGLVAAEYVKP